MKTNPENLNAFTKIITNTNQRYLNGKKDGVDSVLETMIAVERLHEEGKLTALQMVEYEKHIAIMLKICEKYKTGVYFKESA